MAEKQLTIWDFGVTDQELEESFMGVVSKENYNEVYPDADSKYISIMTLLMDRGREREARGISRLVSDRERVREFFYQDIEVQ